MVRNADNLDSCLAEASASAVGTQRWDANVGTLRLALNVDSKRCCQRSMLGGTKRSDVEEGRGSSEERRTSRLIEVRSAVDSGDARDCVVALILAEVSSVSVTAPLLLRELCCSWTSSDTTSLERVRNFFHEVRSTSRTSRDLEVRRRAIQIKLLVHRIFFQGHVDASSSTSGPEFFS